MPPVAVAEEEEHYAALMEDILHSRRRGRRLSLATSMPELARPQPMLSSSAGLEKPTPMLAVSASASSSVAPASAL